MPSLRLPLLLLLLSAAAWAENAAEAPKPDVPKGKVTKYSFDQSKIFPGTIRDYWVYVPQQYDGSKPACLWVNQDGIQFKAPEVFDQLIAAKQMPVTIGVFVMHGRVKGLGNEARLTASTAATSTTGSVTATPVSSSTSCCRTSSPSRS